jgi:hypothetical protein
VTCEAANCSWYVAPPSYVHSANSAQTDASAPLRATIRCETARRSAGVALESSRTGHGPQKSQAAWAAGSPERRTQWSYQFGIERARIRTPGRPSVSAVSVERNWLVNAAAEVICPTVEVQTSFVPDQTVT